MCAGYKLGLAIKAIGLNVDRNIPDLIRSVTRLNDGFGLIAQLEVNDS